MSPSGPSGAASRKLAIWIGGDEQVFNQHKAILDAIGDRAAYVGPIGSATVAKLVHNMSGYAIICALAETFTLGVKAGMDPLTLWQAARQGAVGRRSHSIGGVETAFLAVHLYERLESGKE